MHALLHALLAVAIMVMAMVVVRPPPSPALYSSRLSFDSLSPVSIVSRYVSLVSFSCLRSTVPDPVHSPSCTPRARMSYRRARPLPSRQSFFSPRLRGTVVPLR